MATTAAGNKVWVIDSNKKVYVYDQDGKLLGSWTANGLTTPEDITTNGTDIWIVDDGSNKVFRFTERRQCGQRRRVECDLELRPEQRQRQRQGHRHQRLVLVGRQRHGTTDKVFKYTTAGTLLGSWTIDSSNGSPTGITIDPANVNHIWIVDSGTDAVYHYNAAASRTSGSQNAASLFHWPAGNTNAQGIADPPPNGIDLLDATVQDVGVFGQPQYVSSGLKDRVLADWLAPASTNKLPLRGTASGVPDPLHGSDNATVVAAYVAKGSRAAPPAPSFPPLRFA